MQSAKGSLLIAALVATVRLGQAATPPAGFTALFNGQDLSGWRGGDTFDHRKYLDMSQEDREKQDAACDCSTPDSNVGTDIFTGVTIADTPLAKRS